MDTRSLFSYKMTHDSGFAPNPFHGVLTLATCKPGFRRARRLGDWIAGFTSKTLCGDAVSNERLVYLARISETIGIGDYYRDNRFSRKIPWLLSKRHIDCIGDNIYRPLRPNASAPNEFDQIKNCQHGACQKRHDLGGRNVLVCSEFVYFGGRPLEIPRELRPKIPIAQSAYGAKTKDDGLLRSFIDFVMPQGGITGVLNAPHDWPQDDTSWSEGRYETDPQ
jgi:hypothetical protein